MKERPDFTLPPETMTKDLNKMYEAMVFKISDTEP